MKLFILTLLTIPGLIQGQSNPFDSLEYDKVIAYEFQGEGGRLIEYCLKNDSGRISNFLELSSSQVDSLEILLTSNSSYGNTTASCFDPHFAIVYYKDNRIVGSIDICLSCNYLSSSHFIPATKFKMISVSDEYSYPANGFSKEARKSIYETCKKLGFKKYLMPLTSIFDQ